MYRFVVLLILLCLSLAYCWPARFYVAPTGFDINPGSFEQPFATITKAVGLSTSVLRPGDTIYVRGGQYICAATISISKSGNDSLRYRLLAYPGEQVLLDFSTMSRTSGSRGVYLSGSYWLIRGMDIKGAADNGMNIKGSNNSIEFCSFYENMDTGLQLGSGASNNKIINCDSYFNVDPGQGNADGFAPKLDVGSNNYFYGCRAWQNSDDGWDGYLRGANDVSTVLENCWCFMNGYLRNGLPGTGNGNGYKMGGSDTKDLIHNFTLIRCLAFDNRVKGFDQNNNRGSMTLYHCTGYRNGTNYQIADTLAFSKGKLLTVKNCVALGNYGTLRSGSIQQTNSWTASFPTITMADFLSIDTVGMRGPRKPDGSLPDVRFLVPAPGSQLIDAGTDLGLPFNGNAPDLGAFETGGNTTGVTQTQEAQPVRAELLQCYPNPFNASTTISFILPKTSIVSLAIFNSVGQRIAELINGERGNGRHTIHWDASAAASGVYFVTLQAGESTETRRMILVK